MEIIRGLNNLKARHRGCVATIGNFDGVHRGHQVILQRCRELAKRMNLPLLVITFEPYPDEFFARGNEPPRLTRFREKWGLLAQQGVDRVLCLRFNQSLAGMDATDFIRQVLVEGLGVRHLVVGDDFRFGRQRQGDFAMLCQAGKQHGFVVENTSTVAIDSDRVSSTRVRKALQAGELSQAAQMLGRPYFICGHVAHGDKRGRTIGFPTANIHMHRKVVPLKGVFAVSVDGLAANALPGVANVGLRPTVDGSRMLLEVHLFDFEQQIYGRHVQVNFHQFIRAEKKFDGLEALKQQIAADSTAARNFFKLQSN
ncbi:MAG: bifunctional riboflavin kinase/FAD synthetase [Gammaproteobacteria bacterium]|nr:bifunctional riboflavin kinase/FAD synthetase [Gammaproteobacteria bacterium]